MSENHPSFVAGLLTPAASAIAGFAVAVIALLGQNAVTAAVGNIYPGLFASESGFAFAWGIAVLLEAALAAWLARHALVSGTGWVDPLARAAILVAAVAAAAGVLLIVGGLLQVAD